MERQKGAHNDYHNRTEKISDSEMHFHHFNIHYNIDTWPETTAPNSLSYPHLFIIPKMAQKVNTITISLTSVLPLGGF